MPVQQQPMTPMPFYADPNRFPTPVWQADPSQGWPQGQFIQQIPPTGQPIETYQQYPNGIYQATYQQPAFETNTFYTGAVQVLTNPRPPSTPNQQAQLAPPRPNSNYSHTPSPSPAQQQQQQQQQPGANRQYQEYNMPQQQSQQQQSAQQQNFIPPPTTPTGNESSQTGSNSRPGSVNNIINPPTPNQNFNQSSSQQQTQQQQQQQSSQQQQGNNTFTSMGNFSPNSSGNYANTNSGNAQPGYPPVNSSSPRLVSHSSSGYPGQDQYSGQSNQWQNDGHLMWEQQHVKMEPNYEQQQQQHASEQYIQDVNQSPNKMDQMHNEVQQANKTFSQADKVNLNTRIKTMILNKQQESKSEDQAKPVEQNTTGHFLWYSHHHHLTKGLSVDGGPQKLKPDLSHSQQNQRSHYNGWEASLKRRYDMVDDSSKNGYPQFGGRRADDERVRNGGALKHKAIPVDGMERYSYNNEIRSRGSRPDAQTLNYENHLPRNPKKINGFKNDYDAVKDQRFVDYTYLKNHSFKTAEDATLSNYYMPGTHLQESNRSATPHQYSDLKGFAKFPNSTTSNPEKLPNINETCRKEAETPSPYKSPFKSPKSERNLFSQLDNIKLKNNQWSPNARTKDYLADKNKQLGMEIPNCNCFPPDQAPPEPGTYYTHLGCANTLQSLRYDLECRTGVKGDAIRIEKVRYTGKEGKTALGCPIAKWVIRRQSVDEKYLVVVKQRRGHFCRSTFIVVCLVVWEGVERNNADELYSMLTVKLNKFGLPTKRRCATNEPRTCACQGVNEDSCGASFSFGCSWSMYYNGCKFARSKEVRKFRLSEKVEEVEVEEKLQTLANHLGPMYRCLAPQSFKNQCHFESIASDCRLGHNPGRPFSGVTACVDFCAHAHKDLHNMVNGCTVVVSLTKHRTLAKPADEQLHVLPLYVVEDTDEFGSKENQDEKIRSGAIEVLDKYPCEIRTCSVPAETCLRRNRRGQDGGGKRGRKKGSSSKPPSPLVSAARSVTQSPRAESYDHNSNGGEIQNGQVSSTVLDYPNKLAWRYDNFYDSNNSMYANRSDPVIDSSSGFFRHFPPAPTLPRFSFFKTPFSPSSNPFSNHYSQTGYLRNEYYYPSPDYCYTSSLFQNSPAPHSNHYAAQFTDYPSYNACNPFDDGHSNSSLPFVDPEVDQSKSPKQKVVDISYTDNRECFQDPEIGGVAIALQHGSVLFECAKHELHATTALKTPNRLSPTRISLVFYQHRSLNRAQHGLDEYVEKMRRKMEGGGQSDPDKSDPDPDLPRLDCSFGSLRDCWPRASTTPTMSMTTMFPMYPCIVTGPFQEQLSCALGGKP